MFGLSAKSSVLPTATRGTTLSHSSLFSLARIGITPKPDRAQVRIRYACTLPCQGVFIGVRCPDNANGRTVATQRNGLPEKHLRRSAARRHRNVIVHPSPLHLPGAVSPGECRGVIGRFSAPITDHGTTARGHLYRCTPATYALESTSLGGTLSGAGAPSYQF